jgi:hypothetical protein
MGHFEGLFLPEFLPSDTPQNGFGIDTAIAATRNKCRSTPGHLSVQMPGP